MTERSRLGAPLLLFIAACLSELCGGPAGASAQTAFPLDSTERYESLELSPEEAAAEAYHERLLWLIDHPLDLNSATASDLLALPGITITEVRRLLAWRGRAGAFSQPEQLLAHGAEGGRLYRVIAPFVTATDPLVLTTAIRSRWTFRPGGGAESGEEEDVHPLEMHQLRFRKGSALTLDATVRREPWQQYADAFIGGNVMITRPWVGVDRIVLGDLTPSAAQGVVFGHVQGWSGGGRADAGWSGPLQIVPFHGSSGTRMIRGLGVSMSGRFVDGLIGVGAFAGRTPFMAVLDEEEQVTSIALRATSPPGPASRRTTIHEWSAGGRLAWNPREGIALGASILWSALDRSQATETLTGATFGHTTIGGDLSWSSGPVTVAAEGAWMHDAFAAVLRTGLTLDPRASATIDLWLCSPSYRDRKAGTSVRGDDLSNDAGVSLACMCEPFAGMTCSGGYSRYRRPWATSVERMPQEGSSVVLRIAQRVSRVVVISGGYRSTAAESWGRVDEEGQLPAWRMAHEGRESGHVSIACAITPRFSLTAQIERVHAHAAYPGVPGYGWAMSGEVHLAVSKAVSADLRLLTHATDAYASRVYLLERDVAGAFSAPALYGTGTRWYVLVRATVLRGLQLSGRYAEHVRGTGAFGALAGQTLTLQCDADPAALLPLD